KKPALLALPVLDFNQLSTRQINEMAKTFDRICHQPLLPFSQLTEDRTRNEVDTCVARVLRLPDFSPLRDLLSQEPIITLRRL
ncbi:MAG: hypothetical protein AB1744_12425, partial [Candidatus Zixiibacteriota bacterium]